MTSSCMSSLQNMLIEGSRCLVYFCLFGVLSEKPKCSWSPPKYYKIVRTWLSHNLSGSLPTVCLHFSATAASGKGPHRLRMPAQAEHRVEEIMSAQKAKDCGSRPERLSATDQACCKRLTPRCGSNSFRWPSSPLGGDDGLFQAASGGHSSTDHPLNIQWHRASVWGLSPT